jgi:RNA methyltransferase, TrmH family
MPSYLTSLQNPLVKQMRKLHRGKERREQQLFLLEGTHLLQEALSTGMSLATVCHTPDWQERYPQLWQQTQQQAHRIEAVSPEVLKAIATTVNPDGVVATAARVFARPPVLPISLGIGLETLQDPGNLGTLIRTAAAAGVDGLWLSADSVELDHPKVLRATAGQWFRLPMAISANLQADITACQKMGTQVIATMPTASLTYWEVDLKRPTLLLLGNEGAGLSEQLATMADVQVKIPLAAEVESLNVAIAAAVILYEACRQRGARD